MRYISSMGRALSLWVSLFVCLNAPGRAQSPTAAPKELIVKFKPEAVQSSVAQRTSSLTQLRQSYDIEEAGRLFREQALSRKGSRLQGIYKLTLPNQRDLEEMAESLRQNPAVEYVQPNHVRRIHAATDDPLFAQQRALEIIAAEDAWRLQTATPDIIVGVIDTGIDYEHEDLRDALWLNAGEDLNGNGAVDASDFNGIDDDGNGFIDDIRGWDFVDAPAFPDGGDFRTPDNDPDDEHGHGTTVAGVIGATANNGVGIAGLAYGSRIMNLRAGTSLGFLEEDDVASAIVYAVDNGARVINMSFGDVAASPLLQDVMRYAYHHNCVLIASAGNANTDAIFYPSGFPETISVGATNFDDLRAGFSNYGSSVDIVAPGVNILTTQTGNRYGRFSGTSASAPLVSGLAALLLSKTPELSNEAVRGLLTSTTEDLGDTGWDNVYASGRINAFKALQSPNYVIARLTHPELNQGFADGPIVVAGTAAGAFLREYVLELGTGETPLSWTELLRQENRQVVDAPLFELGIAALPDSLYTLRLRVLNKDGTGVEDKLRFFIDRSPPEISDIRLTPMLDADRHTLLIEFRTDDLTDAGIRYRQKGSVGDFDTFKLQYRTQQHRTHFTQPGELEFFIETTNPAGLTAVADNAGSNFLADLTGPPIGGAPVERLSSTLPSAFLLSSSTDFDGDGAREIVLSRYDNFNFGPLEILEFEHGQFVERAATQQTFIPRDWGDADGDGRLEILAGLGAHSFIFEADSTGRFPTEIVWQDDNAWASRFTDLDRDGNGELIVRVDTTWEIRETVSDNHFSFVQSLPNPTAGTNGVGPPKSISADFDADGNLEILFGDADGDIYIYENRGDDIYQFTWSQRLPLLDTIDYLTSGDYDGDGIAEFAVGCHTDPNLRLESMFDSRHWLYRIYDTDGNDSFTVVWQQAFFGFQPPTAFDSGVSSGDIDNDGRDEVLIHVFPDVYMADFNQTASEYEVVWHSQESRSNATVVEDFDRDAANEFYFNTGTHGQGHRFVSSFAGPPTPLAFRGRPLDVDRIELQWQASGRADAFRVYKGTEPTGLSVLTSVPTPGFIDSAVSQDTAYWYAVTTIDSSAMPPESLPTSPVAVKPGSKPFVETAIFLPPDQVQVRFSEPMARSVQNQTNFEISSLGTPLSSIYHRSGRDVILRSPRQPEPGTYTVTVGNVSDLDGTPLDTLGNAAEFVVEPFTSPPYLVTAVLLNDDLLQLQFDTALDPVTATHPQNYTIAPEIQVRSAELQSNEPNVVNLRLDSGLPLTPLGVDYVVTVRNVANEQGVTIQPGIGDAAAFVLSRTDLSNVFAYPNPYRGDSGQAYVTIAGLTPEATVRILDANGRLVRTLHETDGNGGIQWDLKDDAGNSVASGIYIFYVTAEGDKAMGKVAVVR